MGSHKNNKPDACFFFFFSGGEGGSDLQLQDMFTELLRYPKPESCKQTNSTSQSRACLDANQGSVAVPGGRGTDSTLPVERGWGGIGRDRCALGDKEDAWSLHAGVKGFLFEGCAIVTPITKL